MTTLDEYGRPVEPRLLTAAGSIIPPMPAAARPRSGKWPAFLKRFLKLNPLCAGCGRKAETGHHVVPFHVDPARELDPDNVVAVCIPDHFVLCHAGSWSLVVPNCREVLAAHLPVVKAAQTAV
jgi:hypothetical protein